MKKIGQHTCTPPNSIQFRKFTKPPRSQHIFPFYRPISTVGFLILILDFLLFPPPLLPDLSSLLTYSLLFYLSYREQVFYIVHCNFVYFSPLGDPLDQGLVPVGESIKSINQSINQSINHIIVYRKIKLDCASVQRYAKSRQAAPPCQSRDIA